MYLPKGLFACNALSSVITWHTALPSWLYLRLCKVFLPYLIQIWIPLPGFPNPFPAIFFFIVLSAYKILNSVLTYFCFFYDSMYPTGILALKGSFLCAMSTVVYPTSKTVFGSVSSYWKNAVGEKMSISKLECNCKNNWQTVNSAAESIQWKSWKKLKCFRWQEAEVLCH